MLALDKPTIAAMNGSAAGGGLGIALLHDYRIAADSARLSTAWTRVGVGPEMGASHILPRLVGYRVAFDLMLRSPVLSAAEALDIGLVDQVVQGIPCSTRRCSWPTNSPRCPRWPSRWSSG